MMPSSICHFHSLMWLKNVWIFKNFWSMTLLELEMGPKVGLDSKGFISAN